MQNFMETINTKKLRSLKQCKRFAKPDKNHTGRKSTTKYFFKIQYYLLYYWDNRTIEKTY